MFLHHSLLLFLTPSSITSKLEQNSNYLFDSLSEIKTRSVDYLILFIIEFEMFVSNILERKKNKKILFSLVWSKTIIKKWMKILFKAKESWIFTCKRISFDWREFEQDPFLFVVPGVWKNDIQICVLSVR